MVQQKANKGGSKKIGRAGREPKHVRYNLLHNYTARSNKKARHHRTPLEIYLANQKSYV